MRDRHGNAAADFAAVESALQFVATAPAQERGVMLPPGDVGAHQGLRARDHHRVLGRPVVDARRGKRKFLPDQQSVTIAQVVENLLLQKGPAPDAQHIATHVRVGADAGLVVGRREIGIVRPDRRPIDPLQENRPPVHDAEPRIGPGGSTRAGLPRHVLETDRAGPLIGRRGEPDRQAVGFLRALAVGPPGLDRQVVEFGAGGELGGGNFGRQDAAVAVQQLHLDLAWGRPKEREARWGERAAHVREFPAVADFERDAVPDADLHHPRLPVPRVVEAGLPVLDLRGEIELSQPAWRQVEDDLQGVFRGGRHRRQVKDVLSETVVEAADEPLVAADPARGIEACAAQPADGAGGEPRLGQGGGEDPVAVFDPLGCAAVEVVVPVGNHALLQQELLHRGRHAGRHGRDFRPARGAEFRAREAAPRFGRIAGEYPGAEGEVVNGFHQFGVTGTREKIPGPGPGSNGEL